MSVLGADVSRWQGSVNFIQMRLAGARFCFIKASEHALWVDPRFSESWGKARAAGLLTGAYHYYRPGYKPELQAGNFFQVVAQSECFGELPPVVDFEVDEPDASRFHDTLNWVESLFGRKPIVYTSNNYWYKTVLPWAREYDLWVANYTTANYPLMPVGWERWLFWQYTSHGDGALYGVESGNIDLDRWWGDEAGLLAYAGGEPPAPPPVPDKVRVMVNTLNLRALPGTEPICTVLAYTTRGKVLAVEGRVMDALGRAWYQVGRGLYLAGWLVEAA